MEVEERVQGGAAIRQIPAVAFVIALLSAAARAAGLQIAARPESNPPSDRRESGVSRRRRYAPDFSPACVHAPPAPPSLLAFAVAAWAGTRFSQACARLHASTVGGHAASVGAATLGILIQRGVGDSDPIKQIIIRPRGDSAAPRIMTRDAGRSQHRRASKLHIAIHCRGQRFFLSFF